MNNLIEFIPTGTQNAITRTELTELTGLTDRAARLAIKRLRQSGNVICSSPHGKGYFKPADRAETAAYIKTMRSYAIEFFKDIKAAKQLLKVQDGQAII